MSSSALQTNFAYGGNSSVAPCARIPALVAQLSHLQDAPSTLVEIVKCGAASIPFVADELIQGKRHSIPQPRCYLVQALSFLGATDVLLAYLQSSRPVSDPQVRFAEDVVISAAARALELHFSADIYCVLLTIARERAIPGVLQALALYQQAESIPFFIRALEGDLSRSAALSGLEHFGQAAKSYLIAGVLKVEPNPPDQESGSSLHRRRACLRLLERLALSPEDVDSVFPTLFGADSELVMSACRLVLQQPNERWVSVAMDRLKVLRPHLDWMLEDEADALVSKLEETLPFL